jgi:hypothetical protein
MKNKAIALAQRKILSIAELKILYGSIEACILMSQLEYGFVSDPAGFYKFLKPCSHSCYQPGDSWTEELSITEKEFRSAFKKIGTTFHSKKQFLDHIALSRRVYPVALWKNLPGDPEEITKEKALKREKYERMVFQHKFYLSFRDEGSDLTYYLRNHCAVDRIINKEPKRPEHNQDGAPLVNIYGGER